MKKRFAFLVLLCLSSVAFAQKDSTTKMINMETPPTFKGGIAKFMAFVNKNVKYPNDAWRNNIKGMVTVQFTIDSTGLVLPESVTVVRGLSESCDKEAIRVIQKSPKWIPGMQNGKGVNVLYKLAIAFKPDN